MKISSNRKNAQLSRRAKNADELAKLGGFNVVTRGNSESTRVDVQFKCGCDSCEELIDVYHVRIGEHTWVTDKAEHAIALSEFLFKPVLIWSSQMTRGQYQSIPEPSL